MKTRKTIPMPVRYVINTTLLAIFLLGGTALVNGGVISGYMIKILMLVGINIMLAVSLNVATGYLGQLPLGHAGFMAVGAYAGGIFLKAVEANKAEGVSKLRKLTGFARIVCFGDNHNDLPMFGVADEAYAVGNAVPEAKAAATGVIGSNVELGVARFLRTRAEA